LNLETWRAKILNKEIIYHGECHCIAADYIHDEKCLKRYVFVNDYYKAKSYYIAFCSEWYRLHYKSYIINNPKHYNTHEYLIKEIIKQHTDYSFDRSSWFGCGFKRTASVVVCERPYLYSDIPLTTLLDIIKHQKNDFEILEKSIDACINQINNQIENVLRYVKYKKHHEQAKKIKKLLSDRFNLKYNQDNIIIELTDFITNVIIKNTKTI
jgi:ribulose kinase